MIPPDEQARRAARSAQNALGAALKRKLQRAGHLVGLPWRLTRPGTSEKINAIIYPDGRLLYMTPNGTWYQLSGSTTISPADSATGFPADSQPVTQVKTYAAVWGRSFCALHGVETGAGIWYGDDPYGAHAARKVMIGLPDATIRTDLAGAVIERVELRAVNLDAYVDTVRLHWGLHNQSSAPSEYSAMRRDAAVLDWPKVGTGQEWRDVHVAFGMWLRDNAAAGLTLDQPDGAGNAGAIDWASVQIRITYIL